MGSEPLEEESPKKADKADKALKAKKVTPKKGQYKIKYASAVEKFLGDTFAPELLSN